MNNGLFIYSPLCRSCHLQIKVIHEQVPKLWETEEFTAIPHWRQKAGTPLAAPG
jgi:hypothetical protein